MTAFLESVVTARHNVAHRVDTLFSSTVSLNDIASFRCVFHGQNSPPAKHHAISITSKFDTHDCYDIAIGWPVNPLKHWLFSWSRSPRWFFPWERKALLYPSILDTYYYEQVRPDFVDEEGQKIAIVVDTSDFEIANITGPAFAPDNSLWIHVGEIVDVGQYHIGHNINTFGGCSGGIVVLLDSAWEQPPSVRGEDLGKAIALHVAGTTSLRENMKLAMRLNLDDCQRFCRP